MERRILGIVGLISGILIVTGIFVAWAVASVGPVEISFSGWELTDLSGTIVEKAEAMGAPAGEIARVPAGLSLKLPYVALIGGIVAVIASILAMVRPGVIPTCLLAIGGILAFIGVSWGLVMADIGGLWGAMATMPGVPPGAAMLSIGMGLGAYMCVIGGILSIFVALGLRGK